jgi:tripartite-type tricarboxylate transporter receptor subunit TctC
MLDRRTLLFGLSVWFVGATRAVAQPYPSRLVRIIVPFPPGGGIDVLVRAIAQQLSTTWSQAVIVENRAGAGGITGTEAVARAVPDGLTLLATTNPPITSDRFFYPSLPYDPDALVPVVLMAQSDQLILANSAVPAGDLRELVSLVHREPAKWTYGSFGRGTQPQLLFEMLNKNETLDILHVPYNGIAPLLLGLVAGDVRLTSATAGVAGELIRTGKLKALAVAGKRRSSQFPNVPTTAELGFPYAEASIWYGLFAPPGTAAPIVDKLNKDVAEILTRPDFAQAQLRAKGFDVVAGSPDEFAAALRRETDSVARIVRGAGIGVR